jgi:ABC-type multidrug transport system fused ATPase/permease subunit
MRYTPWVKNILENPGWKFLSKSEKRIFFKLSLIAALLNIFDVLGVLIFGIIGALSVNYISGLTLPSSLENTLNSLGLGNFDSIQQIYIFGMVAVFFFVFKTIVQLLVSNRVYKFLSSVQARVSKIMIEQIISAPYYWTKKQNLNNLTYSIIEGINSLITGVMGNYFIIFSETILLVLILSLMIIVNPSTAIFMSFFLIISSIIFVKMLKKHSQNLGADFSQSSVSTRIYLEILLKAFKEVYVFEKRGHYLDLFNSARLKNSITSSKIIWLQQLPKAWADLLLVLGGLIVAIYQIGTNDAVKGISYLLLFLAAASRLLPSLIKLQGATTANRNYLASAGLSLQTWSEIRHFEKENFFTIAEVPKGDFSNSPVEIQVSGVIFKYPDSDSDVVNIKDLKIKPGCVTAIVGRSGAGKSTFVELLLNIYKPIEGHVLFNGISISQWQVANPGRIGFVPQEVYLVQGSFLDNICLGVLASEVDLKRVNELIEWLGLRKLVEHLPQGLHTQIVGIGNSLSGGEKQRIAIARALYRFPNLLIIDEGTSNQDSETEHSIVDYLQQLRGKTTILVIAHRLSSIQKADEILMFEKGEIVKSGTFTELAETSIEFKSMVHHLTFKD